MYDRLVHGTVDLKFVLCPRITDFTVVQQESMQGISCTSAPAAMLPRGTRDIAKVAVARLANNAYSTMAVATMKYTKLIKPLAHRSSRV